MFNPSVKNQYYVPTSVSYLPSIKYGYNIIIIITNRIINTKYTFSLYSFCI